MNIHRISQLSVSMGREAADAGLGRSTFEPQQGMEGSGVGAIDPGLRALLGRALLSLGRSIALAGLGTAALSWMFYLLCEHAYRLVSFAFSV